jgi:membrane fusion protein (multidrug efflux system)
MHTIGSNHRVEIATLITAFGLGSLLSLVTGCSSPAAAAPPQKDTAPLAVETTFATVVAVPRTVALTGTLVAGRQAEVAAEAGGKVLEVLVERGDAVDAGAPLARLDARAARLSQSEAGASASALLAQSNGAKLECERAERLFAANAITRAELDRSAASCSASAHSVAAARARVSLAAKAFGDAVVRAPFPGIVAERLVVVGDSVGPGRAVVTLVDPSSLRLDLTVPETLTGSVREGRALTFTVGAYPEREFTAKVSRPSPVLRARSRDQIVEVAIDDADGVLKPGMFATARLAIGEDRMPTVPVSAVVGREPAERVFVVRGDGRVEERVVQTGRRSDARVVIVRGVGAGERVVSAPNAAVKDGARVK